MNLVMLTRDAYAPRRPARKERKKGRDNLCAKLFLAFVEKCSFMMSPHESISKNSG